jgi:pyruvate dehydrogenase E1 component alpha subunit
MMLIRRFEEKAAEMYARGRIAGFLHLYIGQEAVGVGATAAIKPDDYVISHYRDHGQALARGVEPGRIMAELFGKATGVSKGRGGSMHLFDIPRKFMGGFAIVGGHLPLACGLGLACRRLGTRQIVLCFFGDGAVNQGEFHESLNLASIWQLPVIFLCENNLYGMGTNVRKVSAEPDIWKRACAYNLPAEQVDGMDVLAVREATRRAANHAREGKGAYFIETVTYRFRGHSMADPEFYRTKAEVEEWRQRDPIVRFKDSWSSGGWMGRGSRHRTRSSASLPTPALCRGEPRPRPGVSARLRLQGVAPCRKRLFAMPYVERFRRSWRVTNE